MRNVRISGICIVAICVVLFVLPSVASAAYIDCDRGGTRDDRRAGPLQRAIDRAHSGDTIVVSGTCRENVTLPIGKDSITLDGRGTGIITGVDSMQPAILVRGRDVTIAGFTITGGLVGVAFRDGGSGRVDSNTIRDAAVYGVGVSVLATAVIVNNIIQNNGQAGIAVAENANAFIGFVTASDPIASPNRITDNGTQGIVVFRNSYARIVGNDISHNRANGIIVREASHALITDNTISGNGQHGIAVLQGSGIILGSSAGTTIFTRANSTTINNSGFGVICQISGFADGGLGSLNGANGAESYAEGCVPSLTP